jgi:hypothetical protein
LSASKWLRDDERERLAERTAELEAELKPEGSLQRDQAAALAAAKVRIESCDMEEENRRFHRAQRAEYYWDQDRRAEADTLLARLDRNPSLYAPRLRQTLHGAQRLRRAFAALAALVAGGAAGEGEPARPLDAVSRERAFDLLGLEPEERQGITPLDLPDGCSGDDAALAAHQAAVIAQELADLDQLTSESYVELDEQNRLETMLGNFPDIDNDTRLIRRYRSEAVRRADRALAELRRLQDEAAGRDKPAWEQEIDRMNADRLRRANVGASTRPPAASAGAWPEPPPRPEPAEKPVPPAANVAEDPMPAGAQTTTAPQDVAPSPRAGQPGGSPGVRHGSMPQPPRAQSYLQKAAHRTLQ